MPETHKRQQIREAIFAALDAVPALTGRGAMTRTRRTAEREMPAWIVYTISESSSLANMGRPRSLMRPLGVAIELQVAATDDLDAAVDAQCLLVEQAMETDFKFGGLAINSWLASTDVTLAGEGDRRHAVVQLAYRLDYQSAAGNATS